jgi:hypothetical protein
MGPVPTYQNTSFLEIEGQVSSLLTRLLTHVYSYVIHLVGILRAFSRVCLYISWALSCQKKKQRCSYRCLQIYWSLVSG